MKKCFVIISSLFVAAVSFISCEKEVKTVDSPSENSALMTVNAGEIITKTFIEESGSNYNVKWSSGDKIAAFEVGNGVVATSKTSSSELAADAASATFTMDFSGNTSLSANYSYLFVYPAGALSQKSDIYRGRIKWDQTFSTTSYDKDADLLISEAVSDQTTRPTSVNVGFARVGATVLMNIKAPTTSETIQSIEFSTTQGNIAGYLEIYPLTGTYDTDIYEGYKSITLTPATSTTYTGTIPVWFRCAAIDLNTDFTVTVHTTGKSYTKTVDLASASKTIKFENAAMTKFNVDMTSAAAYTHFTVGTEITSIFPATKAGVKFSNAQGAGSTAPFYASPYNWYKNSDVTISAGTTGNITKVVFNFGSLDAEPAFSNNDDDSNFALVGTTGTWTVGTDPVTSVTFTNTAKKATISSIDVFYTGTPNETVVISTPTIAFANAAIDVAMGGTRTNVATSNYNNGAITYASLDVSKATVNSTTGEITPVAPGVVTIRATIAGSSTAYTVINSNTADCIVTVTVPATYDVLNYAWTGISGTAYAAWADKDGSYSSAVYAGTSGGTNSSIQLNSGSPRGIISTTSGGILSNVAIAWNSNTNDGRTLQVYGSNVPYAGSGDLSNAATRGTLIGEIVKGTSTSLDVDSYYEYVGLYATGALYIDEARITWEDAKTRIGSPTSFSASASGDDITVTWVDVASGVSKYLVTCYGQPDQLINPGVQTASFENLDDGTYKVSIRAIPSDLSTYSYSAIQSSNVVVSAGPVALLTCDMTLKTANQSSYNTTTTYGNWVIKYGANNNGAWAYYKMGGKKATIADYNPCEIYSTKATTAAAASVAVHIPTGSLSKSGMSVTSWGVEVYNNSDYAVGHKIDTAKGGGTITASEGTFTFYPSDDYQTANSRTTWPSGCYFKVTWTLANTTTTNGIVCVDKVTVYGE
ncbi:MAG: hypothetical protein IKX45_01810 [Bacteroidales bacterium]|nr:hypothetical protein [Bacteroidales bacterium]